MRSNGRGLLRDLSKYRDGLLLVVHHLLRWIHLETLDSIDDKGSESSRE